MIEKALEALEDLKIEAEKIKMSEAKKARKLQRKKAQEEITDNAALEIIMADLVRKSLKDKFLFRELNDYLEKELKIDSNSEKTYNYSNLGAGLLGHTLGLSEQQTFVELLRKQIL